MEAKSTVPNDRRRPDGPWSNYGGWDLLPWKEVADKVGLKESVARQYGTNALRKLRLAMRIQELHEEGLSFAAIRETILAEKHVDLSVAWHTGFIKGVLNIDDGN